MGSKDFQGIILALQQFWNRQGCVLQQPYDVEVGAGTMAPETFLRVLGPEPYRVAYVMPSRRPADGRYGDNPNRLYKHHQYQVILKPAPADVQDLYLESLGALGINLADHDLRFEEDNWESPTLGAWGIGWQVLLDGLEITQFTYFQQAGGLDLYPVSSEITYGLERIGTFIAQVNSIYDLPWGGNVSYREVRHREEFEFSKYNFEAADVEMLFKLFNLFEAECKRLLKMELVLPAYDYCLRCSHTFNLLDSRGAISVTERVGMIGRVRQLACQVARGYVASREMQGFPLQGPSPSQ
ncbi:MAG: glycine--tRNA ligase subunit alpha [Acidobacteria bacterium]|nr:MAG: glycine--tRNA ligase subunit alpha [Acidobacteriota bacterium]